MFGAFTKRVPKADDHPLLSPAEWDFAADPDTFATQAAGDMDLLERVHATLKAKRAVGNGKLRDVHDPATFFGQDPFLDQHCVHVSAQSGAQRSSCWCSATCTAATRA